ncbi:hypothetical protein ACWGIB_01070 [Streptomyces xiamenensis]
MGDDVREYLALFYPQVSFGGPAFGGASGRSPFTAAAIEDPALPEVLAEPAAARAISETSS